MQLCRSHATGRAGKKEVVAYTGNSQVELARNGLQSQLLTESPESGKARHCWVKALLAITDLNQHGKEAVSGYRIRLVGKAGITSSCTCFTSHRPEAVPVPSASTVVMWLTSLVTVTSSFLSAQSTHLWNSYLSCILPNYSHNSWFFCVRHSQSQYSCIPPLYHSWPPWCVHVCTHTYMCSCLCTRVHMWRPEESISCHSLGTIHLAVCFKLLFILNMLCV